MNEKLKPVKELTDQELFIEYIKFVFVGPTEQLEKNVGKSRFQEIMEENERRNK